VSARVAQSLEEQRDKRSVRVLDASRGVSATADVAATWRCMATHVGKAAGSGADAAPATAADEADNDFRFTVAQAPPPSSLLSFAFVAGLNRTRESFMRIVDQIEGDVARSNRAWRRRLAGAAGGGAGAGK
jgi:hypothetical protein